LDQGKGRFPSDDFTWIAAIIQQYFAGVQPLVASLPEGKSRLYPKNSGG
jgi:hypothetical protein